MNGMQIGFGIFPGTDGKHNAVLQVSEGHVNFAVTFTNEDNADHDINELIKGLKQIQGDLRRVKSGLVLAKEVPNGFGSVEGRAPHSTGREGK